MTKNVTYNLLIIILILIKSKKTTLSIIEKIYSTSYHDHQILYEN